MSPRRARTNFYYWWTAEEWSHDTRTGAFAQINQKTASGVWKWVVQSASGQQEGVGTTQKGARAACRRVVSKLPSKAT